MRVPAPPATTAQQTWKGPQAAQRLGILFGREGVPSGPAQGGACGVSQVGPGASAVGRWSLLDRCRLEPATWVPARSRAGGAVGYCVPFGWSGLFRCLGTQRPGGPACPAGSPFLPRNGEKEGRGQAPWTPGFMARSFPLAGFGVVGRIVPVEGLVRCPCTCPDLGRFFRVGLHSPEASPWGEAVTEGD